jgi:hypothetical protein
LVLIPWSAFWDRNYFIAWSSALSDLVKSNYTRGAVSGLGLVNVWAALAELADMFGSRGDGNQQSEAGNQQSEASNQQSEAGNQQSEDGNQQSEASNQ